MIHDRYAILVAAMKAQIAKEDRFTAIHRDNGDKAKMRAAMQTAAVLRRLLRETEGNG